MSAHYFIFSVFMFCTLITIMCYSAGAGLATSASSHALGESSPPISPITMSHTTPAIYPCSGLNAPSSCQPSSLQYLPPNSGYSSTMTSSGYNTYPQSYGKNSTLLSGISSNISALGQSTLGTTALGGTSLQTTLGQSKFLIFNFKFSNYVSSFFNGCNPK